MEDEEWLKSIALASNANEKMLSKMHHSGWSPDDKFKAWNVFQEISATTDLRTVKIPREIHHGLARAVVAQWTFPGRFLDLGPILNGTVEMGPLSELLVYGSDLSGRYSGPGWGYAGRGSKSHAAFDCQHSVGIHPHETDCLRLDTFIHHTPDFSPCTWCAGYTFQLLTDDQWEYYMSSTS